MRIRRWPEQQEQEQQRQQEKRDGWERMAGGMLQSVSQTRQRQREREIVRKRERERERERDREGTKRVKRIFMETRQQHRDIF